MSYVIAAYAVTVIILGGYGLHLSRERAALRRELSGGDESNAG